MHTAIATIFAAVDAALASPVVPESSGVFQLFAYGDIIESFPLVSVKIDAIRHVVQIQRPAAFSSDISYLEDGALFFDVHGKSCFLEGPLVTDEEVRKAYTICDADGPRASDKPFSLNDDGYLEVNGSTKGWWACFICQTLELYRGPEDPEAAGNSTTFPSDDCKPVQLAKYH
ncbi:hypothetical protein GGS20DRAFT_570625 [Poronia punctata]|nr:hypothetical protein GGS20DRAFT_570625 [Poronia punctata]